MTTAREHLAEILRLAQLDAQHDRGARIANHFWAALGYPGVVPSFENPLPDPLPIPPLVTSARTARLEIRLEHAIFGLRSWRGCVVSESTDQNKFVFFADADDPLESRCIRFAWNTLNYLEVRNK